MRIYKLNYLVYALAIILLVWLLLRWGFAPKANENTLLEEGNQVQQIQTEWVGSAIQPLSPEAEKQLGIINESDLPSVEQPQSISIQDLTRRFADATSALESSSFEQAQQLYLALIDDYPSTAENYINLAYVYGKQGKLEQAKQILEQGTNAKRHTKIIVQGLNRINGVLAAQAYKQALDVNQKHNSDEVVLARVTTLHTQLDTRDELTQLNRQLNELSQSSAGSDALVERYRLQIQDLQAQLVSKDDSLAKLQNTQSANDDRLQQQLTELRESLQKSQAAEREALARVVRAEEDAQIQVTAAQAETQRLRDQIANDLAYRQPPVGLVSPSSSVSRPSDDDVSGAQNLADPKMASGEMTEVQSSQAIAQVQEWAAAWSALDVNRYISRYVSGYTSSSSASHQQWRAQRLVRLTNKRFIDVQVSDFKVEDLGERFVVSFRQHYRSDVINDKVRKQLVFSKDGDDWSKARIVAERLIRN